MTLATPPATLRILGLGDTTMFGLGVPQEKTYMSQLGREFGDLLRGTCNVESVNTGCMGYNPVQELAMLEDTGLAMEPDVEPDTPLEPSHERILGVWKRLEITTIETLPAAKEHLAENRKQWVDAINRLGDPHPNAVGHAIIARELLNPLRDVLLSKAGVKFEDLPTSATFGQLTRARLLDKVHP